MWDGTTNVTLRGSTYLPLVMNNKVRLMYVMTQSWYICIVWFEGQSWYILY
jgi:hypothetical protein